MTAEKRYQSLVKTLLSGHSPSARIGEGKGFGSTGQLRFDGKIFAMLVRGKLVLKLPRDRVDALVDSGDGERFDAGKGRQMREWLALSSTSRKSWLALSKEAIAFVSRKR
jgi:TfoX/Sxy family transcriptional regulator of competence genes